MARVAALFAVLLARQVFLLSVGRGRVLPAVLAGLAAAVTLVLVLRAYRAPRD